jgi:acetyltransferase
MVQYQRNQALLYETPEAMPEDWSPDSGKVRQVLDQVRQQGRLLLTEVEAKEVLAAYGVPITPTVACRSVEETVAAARQIGFPVVLKLLSQTITHKTDVGGVRLNLADDTAVRDAFNGIRAKLAELGQAHAFDGVTVQPMVRVKGQELIVGSSLDRQFGPVILFGAGGVLVEVFKDRALGLPPLNRSLARRLIEQTQIHKALHGVRGSDPVNQEALESLLVRFSQLVVDFPDISEIDINPLLAGAEQIVALDARILLTRAALPEDERPRLAIMPYPNQYVERFQLRDGTELTVRPIRPEDEPLIVAFHAGHSEHTLRMRFFGLVRVLSRESLIRLCHLDYDRELALVAVQHQDRQRHIVGVSRYFLRPETGEAEFAIVVGDAWHGRGIGTHLMERLIAIARERGVKRLVGQILSENEAMLDLVKRLKFQVRPTEDSRVVEATCELGPA